MTDGRVRFAIGPVPSDVARAWLDNSRRLVHAVRARPGQVSIDLSDHALEFCVAVLDVWSSAAERSDVFEWAIDTTPDQLLMLCRQWLAIGELTADELDALGCTWAPPWTRPMAAALEAGVLASLGELGGAGDEMIAQLARDDILSSQ